MKNHIIILLLLFSTQIFAQQADKEGKFIPLHLFTQAKEAEYPETLKAGTTLEIDHDGFKEAQSAAFELISIDLPQFQGANFELQLTKTDIFTEDFKVDSEFGDITETVDRGIHYQGFLKGEPSAMVALSFLSGGELMATIHSETGTWVLGKIKGKNPTGNHIFYLDKDLTQASEFDCATIDDGLAYKSEEVKPLSNITAIDNCLRIHIEINDDICADKGGQSTAYAAALFNQSARLYANEGIRMEVSGMFLWCSPSPYTSGNTNTLLSQFQNTRTTFNGDLAHLITYKSNGGLAAGFNGLCNPDRRQSMCVSGIQNNFPNVPTYSWTIMVFTHEMGHLLGSRHTHACVWNGNGTAIDGCSGYTEGNCSVPGTPSNGGTIMSYCHWQSVGINFNLGFGPQPGNVIRNNIANAACMLTCPCPSNLTLFGVNGGIIDYEASSTISSTQTFIPSAEIEFKAADLIMLKTGFVAQSGSNFHARIGNCGPSFTSKNEEGTTPEEESLAATSRNKLEKQDLTTLTCLPNPFNHATTIAYSLATDEEIQLSIHDINGRLIDQLFAGKQLKGQHQIRFEAKDLPAGIYLVQLQTSTGVETQKMVLNR